MSTHAFEDVGVRLAELRHDELYDFALSAGALVGSLAMTVLYPPLAVPLLIGGVAIGARALVALWQRWDLVDRLADDREAYVIPEVRAYAVRETRMDRRRYYAAAIRSRLDRPGCRPDAEFVATAEQLELLARDLEDVGLDLEPACAMACRRLVTEPSASPLLKGNLASEDIRPWTVRIRAGFKPRAPNGPGQS